MSDHITLLRHTVATLAYRLEKVVREVPDGFDGFAIGAGVRTPLAILAHIGDLLEWAAQLAEGKDRWTPGDWLPWEQERERVFAALARLDKRLAAGPPGRPAEQIFQGPIADALTHVGQLAMIRRVAGQPVRGESYARAEIVVGRVGPEQSARRAEFDGDSSRREDVVQ
jgi:hypothetical protein